MEAARRRAHPITCACLQIKAPARPMLMPNKTWLTWVRKWTMIWRLMGTGKTLLTEIISQILGASDSTISHHYKIHRRMELERRHRAIWISRSYVVWLRPKISSYPSNISSNSKVHHWRTTECDWIQIFWIVFVTVAKRKSISAILIYVSPSIFSLQLATRHKRPIIQFAKPFFVIIPRMKCSRMIKSSAVLHNSAALFPSSMTCVLIVVLLILAPFAILKYARNVGSPATILLN